MFVDRKGDHLSPSTLVRASITMMDRNGRHWPSIEDTKAFPLARVRRSGLDDYKPDLRAWSVMSCAGSRNLTRPTVPPFVHDTLRGGRVDGRI